MKIAAIEAMWNTEPAPASFTVVGLPDQAAHETRYAVRIPWLLGPDRHPLDRRRGGRHRRPGATGRASASAAASMAYAAMRALRTDRNDAALRAIFDAACQRSRLRAAAEALHADGDRRDRRPRSHAAAWDTVPPVAPLFWTLPRHGGARLLLHRAVRA